MIKKPIDLVCMPSDNPGGAENILKQIAIEGISKNEVEVIILKKRQTNFWANVPSNIKINYLDNSHHYIGFLKLIFLTLKRSMQFNIHYVISSQSYVNGLLGFLRKIRILKCKFLIIRESTIPFDRFSGIKLFLYKLPYYIGYSSSNLIICQTNKMKDILLGNFPRLKNKVKILQNPINLIEADIKGNIDVEKFIDFSKPYIISAGRLIHEKGYDILIRSFSLLKLEDKSLQLIILGEGYAKQELQSLIESLNLKNKVFLLGQVQNVHPYFKFARVCIVASRIEGFPNVLLQMMSQNGNVVSTLCASGIEDISSIIKCLPNNIVDLQHALEIALSEDLSKTKMNQKENRLFLEQHTITKYTEDITNNIHI